MMDTALTRAAHRLQVARHILAELQLLARWRPYGDPVLVGAVAFGLVVAPDIDLEIFCDEPRIADGFEVLKACANHPRVYKARFSNHMEGPDMGYYWQLRYLHDDGQEWKVDMWSVRRDHPGPLSSALVGPMLQALTEATRRTILELKEQLLLEPGIACGSIHLYRAVLEGGVGTLEQLKTWLEGRPTTGLIDWHPGI